MNIAKNRLFILLAALCASFIFAVIFYTSNPIHNANKIVTIESGKNVTSISKLLKAEGIVRSTFLLRTVVILLGGEKKIVPGDYLFEPKENLFTVARMITSGDFGMPMIKVTVPEGTNNSELTKIISVKFPGIASSSFLDLIKDEEGYLFPETYFFQPTVRSDQIESRMKKEFVRNTDPLDMDVKSSGHSLEEIIIMASILEQEVKSNEDRKIVADILWRRISTGLPLQVDSSLAYINGKASSELTMNDLKIKSPFNTYINKGLPPTPICNPGLDSIKDALYPTTNKYVFFLTGKDGKTYFAETFKEHLANKKRYLGK